MNSEQKMREALEYVAAYIEERDDWQGTEPIIADIQKALAAPAGEKVGLTDESSENTTLEEIKAIRSKESFMSLMADSGD